MGNCIRKESPMKWAREDWDSPAPEPLFSGEEKRLLGGGDNNKGVVCPLYSSPSVTATSTTEVKIKITKKQLEELLGQMEVQGLSVQQLLAQLMSGGDAFEAHRRSWRPALQSIPEIN